VYAIATVVALVMPWMAVLLFILLTLFYLWPRWGRKSTTLPTNDSTMSSDRNAGD
jgi:hypothetical protein